MPNPHPIATPSPLARQLAATAAVYLLLIAAMIRWHWRQGPPYTGGTSALAVAFGLCTALVGLLTIGAALAAMHWTKRAAGFIVGLAVLAALWIAFFDWEPYLIWQLLIVLAVQMGAVLLALALARLAGYALVRRDASPALNSGEPALYSSQFSIHDMLLLTGAIAILLAVLRLAQPIELGPTLYVLVVVAGVAAAMAVLAALWACLSSSSLLGSVLVLLIVAPIGGPVYLWASRHMALMFSAQWYTAVTVLLTLFTTLPLALIARHGYRFSHREAASANSQGPSETEGASEPAEIGGDPFRFVR